MPLDAIGIASKDMKETVRFYALLGVDLKEEGGPEHYEGSTPSGIRIMADTVELMKKINPDWVEPVGSGMSLAFVLDAPADVDVTFEKIREAGFKTIKDPWDAFWGQRYALVHDPDGNEVALFAALP